MANEPQKITLTSSSTSTLPPSTERPNISIQGSPEFQSAAARELDRFLSTQTGQRWSEAYRQTGQTVTVRPTTVGSTAQPTSSGTLIYFNPKQSYWYVAGDGSLQKILPYQSMGHELIHALHNAEGSTAVYTPLGNNLHNQAEADAIGVGNFSGDDITEAALLNEINQPRRVDHVGFETKYGAEMGKEKILESRSNGTAASSSMTATLITLALVGALVALILFRMLSHKRDVEPVIPTETQTHDLYVQLNQANGQLSAAPSPAAGTLNIVVPATGSNGAGFDVVSVEASDAYTATEGPSELYQPLFSNLPNGQMQTQSRGVAALANQKAILTTPSSASAAAQRAQYAASLNKQIQE